MRNGDALEDGDREWPMRAVVAGLAALYAAALALGVFDGVPPERSHRRAAPGVVAAGGRDAALPPGLRLCFHGPGGELIGFSAAAERPLPVMAEAGSRGTGTP